MARPKQTVQPETVAGNEHVIEFFKIMQENNLPTVKDLLVILKQIETMETQLTAAVKELAAMRQDLTEAQKQNHPIRNALQKSVILMQNQVLHLRDRLAELKRDFIEGCKNVVTAFKEKGISALDNTVRFFKLRPALESLQKDLNEYVTALSRLEERAAEKQPSIQETLKTLNQKIAQEKAPIREKSQIVGGDR